jgi:hypothetical protein
VAGQAGQPEQDNQDSTAGTGQPRQDIRTDMTGHQKRTAGKDQSGQGDLADKPGQASLNRIERTGWPQHDRKDKTAGPGLLRQDSPKRTYSKGLPGQVSL